MGKILIIEDDEDTLSALMLYLKTTGHEIVGAKNGHDGIGQQNSDPADLVITDLLMPGKDGFAVIQEVQKKHPATKIIAISGGSTDAKKLNLLKTAELMGVQATLEKPFSPTELIQVVLQVLKNASRAPDPKMQQSS